MLVLWLISVDEPFFQVCQQVRKRGQRCGLLAVESVECLCERVELQGGEGAEL